MRPKLLYVVTEDWSFTLHRLPMARAARDAGYEVHVATRVVDRRPQIESEGFILHAITLKRGSLNPLAMLRTVRDLRRIYRSIRPDIVHHVALAPAVLGSLASLGLSLQKVDALTGLGFIFTSATPRARLLRPFVQRLLTFLLSRPGTTVLVQNPDDRDAAKQLGVRGEHIALIPGSGVDIDLLLPLPEPELPFTVGFVGRLLYDKGVQILVEAHRLLTERGQPFRLLLAGTPDASNPASIPQSILDQWRQTEGIVLLGQVADISTVWAKAHIAALPSRREGLPKTLLEAAACGRAMVATDVPGCREIVRDGLTGVLVPAESPEALARAIERLMDDPQLRQRYGLAARQAAVEEFSSERVGRDIVALYERVLTEHPTGALATAAVRR
jgi:glycosyltransferase involved in cell wall biosynthesis